MKKLLLGSVVLAGLAFAGFSYWQQTPEYSLLQIKQALDTKDSYLFEKHVDLERLISRGVDTFIKSWMNQQDQSYDSEAEELGATLAKNIIEGIAPLATLYLKNLVIDQVEGSISNNEDGEGNSVVENLFSVNPEQRMGIKESLATAEQEHLRQDGNNAFLGVSIVNKESAQTLLIEFKLQKYDDYWRVTEISNLETLLRQLQN